MKQHVSEEVASGCGRSRRAAPIIMSLACMQTYTIHLNLTVYSFLSKTAIWSWNWLSILRQIIIFKMSIKEILKCLSTCEEIEKRLIVAIWCTMQNVGSRSFAELWWILSTQRHSWNLTEGAEWCYTPCLWQPSTEGLFRLNWTMHVICRSIGYFKYHGNLQRNC